MSTTLKRYVHNDTNGTKWEIKFFGSAGSEDTTIRDLSNPFFTLTYEGDRVKRSRLEVHVIKKSASDVASYSDVDDYLTHAILYKDDSPYWYGNVYFEAAEIQEGDYPYTEVYTFKDPLLDGLVSLSQAATYKSFIDLIVLANDETLEITTYPAWSNTDVTGDFFNEVFIDAWTFRDIGSSEQDESDDEQVSWEFLLTQLLQAVDGYLIQSDYRWRIFQHDTFPARVTYQGYEYAADGAQQNGGAVGSAGARYTIGDTTRLLPSSSSYKERPYEQAAYLYNHRSLESGIRYPGEGLVLDPGQTDLKTTPYYGVVETIDSFYFKASVTAEPYGDYSPKIQAEPQITVEGYNSTTDTSVYWTGFAWSTTATKVTLAKIPGVPQNEFGATKHTFEGDIEIKTEPINVLQLGDQIRVTIQPLLVSANEVTTIYSDIEFTVISEDEDAQNSTVIAMSLSTSSLGNSFRLPTSLIGYGPKGISRGALRIYDSVNNQYIRIGEQWNRIGVTESREYSAMVLRSVLDRIRFSRKILRANIYGTYSPERLLSNTYDSKVYSFERGRLTGVQGVWSIFMSEVRGTLASIDLDDAENVDFVQDARGIIPGVTASRNYKASAGIKANRIPQDIVVLRAAFGADGVGATVTTVNGDPLPDGSVAYSTTAGDTLPYFYTALELYDNVNVFKSATDDWSAATASTNLLFSSQARLGAIDSGLLQMDMTSQPVSSQEFAIEKALVDQEYTGYFKCEVFIPSENGTTQGVKIVAGTESDSTLTVGEWITLELLNRDPEKVEIKGTDVYGAVSYIPTFEDKIYIRNVSFIGNVFEFTAGVVECFDPQTFDWVADQHILIAKSIDSGTIVNFGFVTSVSGSGDPTAVENDDYNLDGLYQIIGRWEKTIVSISGDILTTGTLNAALVSITGLDTEGSQVIRSNSEPTQRPDTTNLQGGDIWIDTDDNDRIYTWNPYPFEVWVETLTAISGSNIVTGTIDASQVTVTNIDADNINTGTLDASQVTITNFSAGNEVIRSSTEPTTRGDSSALQDGDVWIDTDDGNRPYVYAGYPTEAFQQALTVISGNNITTGTIDASVVTVSNLDANDISGSTVTIRSDTEPTTRDGGGALQEGDIWIDTYNGDKPYSYDGADFVAAYTQIDGGNITTGTITANKITVDNLNAIKANTGNLTVDGSLTVTGSNGKLIGSSYEFTNVGGNIAGWRITTGLLSSAENGTARIELNKTDSRVQIKNTSDEPIVAMGFLEGLPKNAGGGNWEAGTYGFWAKSGDKIEIDGDVEYEDGDFIIQSDGAVKSQNYSAGSLGFIISGAGNAEFNEVTVRGAIIAGASSELDGQYIDDGTILATKIDTDDLFAEEITIGTKTGSDGFIQSTGFTDGSVGFRLNADGTAFFNSIEISGAVRTQAVQLYATDFSLDNDFANFNTLMLVKTHDGETNALEVTLDTGNVERYIRLPTANGRTTFQSGKDYTISFKYYLADSQTATEILVGTDNTGDLRFVADTKDAWTTASFNILQPTGSQLRFYSSDGYGTTYNSASLEYFYIKDVVISDLPRVDGGYIIANTITADKIAAGTITANEIEANTITADLLDIQGLSAVATDTGALTVTGDLTLDSSSEIKITNAISLKSITSPSTGAGFLGATGIIYLDSQGVIINGVGTGSGYGVKTSESGLVQVASASGVALGFFDGGGATKQTVTGSRGGNAALASLLDALEAYGLITDSST